MAVSAPPPRWVEIDDGVIEEARRRQHRRQIGIAALLAAAAITALVLMSLSSDGARGRAREVAFRPGPPRLTFVNGLPYINGRLFPLTVRPYLGVGAAIFVNGWDWGAGMQYPQRGTPLFGNDGYQPGPTHGGRNGPRGQIEWFLTEPDVAKVRVSEVGTFKPVTLPGLPPGDHAVVFFRPNNASAAVTPLDAAGHPIPSFPPIPQYPPPNSYWQGTQNTPRIGRCALRSGEHGVRVSFGTVATEISADPYAIGPAFFSCLDEWFILPRTGSLEAAILLNAQHPGSTPAPLWGAREIPGLPGLVEVPPS